MSVGGPLSPDMGLTPTSERENRLRSQTKVFLFDDRETLNQLSYRERLLLCSMKESGIYPLVEIKKVSGNMSGAVVVFYTPVAHDGTRLPATCLKLDKSDSLRLEGRKTKLYGPLFGLCTPEIKDEKFSEDIPVWEETKILQGFVFLTKEEVGFVGFDEALLVKNVGSFPGIFRRGSSVDGGEQLCAWIFRRGSSVDSVVGTWLNFDSVPTVFENLGGIFGSDCGAQRLVALGSPMGRPGGRFTSCHRPRDGGQAPTVRETVDKPACPPSRGRWQQLAHRLADGGSLSGTQTIAPAPSSGTHPPRRGAPHKLLFRDLRRDRDTDGITNFSTLTLSTPPISAPNFVRSTPTTLPLRSCRRW